LTTPLYGMVYDDTWPARMSISLPENYRPDKQYPLFLWINGGHGGPGGNLRIPKTVTENTDYICANFPLFKETLAPVSEDGRNFWGRMAIGHREQEILWKSYQVMLERVYQSVPNIDREKSVLGGFSNGAHTTSVLLDTQDMIRKYFSRFVLIEGGGRLQHLEKLQGHSILIVRGGDSRGSEPLVGLHQRLANEGVDAEFKVMEGVGHEFPDEHFDVLRTWLSR